MDPVHGKVPLAVGNLLKLGEDGRLVVSLSSEERYVMVTPELLIATLKQLDHIVLSGQLVFLFVLGPL